MFSPFAKFLLFTLLLVAFTSWPTLGEDDFNYINGSDKGPANWGDIKPEWAKCKTGQMQSPISITYNNVVNVASLGHLTRNYKPANATLTRDHDVAVEWEGDAGFIVLDKKANYTIDNVHWHAPSEHIVGGIRYDLELHMVHFNTNSSAVKYITVIAHMYHFGPPDPFLAMLISRIAQLNETNNSTSLGPIDPRAVIYNGPTYYRYMGSLTTPPCSENVTWIIDRTIKHVSREQVQILRNAVGDNGEGNARPIQPLNNRTILSGPFSRF